ncbi:MAG: endonuclease domain-containing protein [bacterium]|nr:endonuclease domain-containing protein [bacterium]
MDYVDRELLRKVLHRDRARELRKRSTPAESALWKLLRDRRLSQFKFRRQHPLRHYILDFFCPQARVAVELDGEYHDDPDQTDLDEERTAELTVHDIRVVRFQNSEVLTDPDSVLEQLLEVLRSRRIRR